MGTTHQNPDTRHPPQKKIFIVAGSPNSSSSSTAGLGVERSALSKPTITPALYLCACGAPTAPGPANGRVGTFSRDPQDDLWPYRSFLLIEVIIHFHRGLDFCVKRSACHGHSSVTELEKPETYKADAYSGA
jgi:hypothetical protein